MVLDYTIPGKVQSKMDAFIHAMLGELPPNIDSMASTPAAEHLFPINIKDPQLLDDDTAIMFHHYVSKLLFLCKWACPDIQTAIAFLTTWVQ